MKRFILSILVCMMVGSVVRAEIDGGVIIQTAKALIGCPYKYGGVGPSSFDCSGLVRYCFQQNGYALPRTSGEMSRLGIMVEDWEQLQTGDLVFFGKNNIQHVGIYVGKQRNEHLFIHASTSQGVIITPLEDNYWRKIYRFGKHISEIGAYQPAPKDETVDDALEQKETQSQQTRLGSAAKAATYKTGSGTVGATIDMGSGAIPATKHWKRPVKIGARKKVVYNQE